MPNQNLSNEYVTQFHSAIRDGKSDNTYRVAWARAILESLPTKTAVPGHDEVTLTFLEIADRMLEYYWDHTLFFNLQQGKSATRLPELLEITTSLIEDFQKATKDITPKRFTQVRALIPNLEKKIQRASMVLKQDVSHKFTMVGRETLDLYTLHKEGTEPSLGIRRKNAEELVSASALLSDAIFLKWTILCEGWNTCPNIGKKIRMIQDSSGEGSSNTSTFRFREFLLLDNENSKCFYTLKDLTAEEIAIDHVLPWSYLYSEDLWNLVVCCSRFHSSVGNSLPTRDEIARLCARNLRLLPLMQKHFPNEDATLDLERAIKDRLVEKYYSDLT